MNKIQAQAQSIRNLLDGKKYQIDYYQREYRWEQKQINELIDDLVSTFLSEYRPDHKRHQVEQYSHYFLGSVLMSDKADGRYIVDGQQRLTSLTLLLIYLRNLQEKSPNSVDIDNLIFSERYGTKSFNMNVPERTPVLESLWEKSDFESDNESESVRNIAYRYADIQSRFPFGDMDVDGDDEEDAGEGPGDEYSALDEHALPYFIDWLIDNVFLVEITAFSDNDAYTIFETMNDRGLSLTPTDMLKGYLLANITLDDRRKVASDEWKSLLRKLQDLNGDAESDFFKAWIRSQYAESIRDRRKGAKPKDYDLIGTEFHRWVKDEADTVGLHDSDDFFRFIHDDMRFYGSVYERIERASSTVTSGLERVRYNAQIGFTLQNMLLLAPLRPHDPIELQLQKLRIVSTYVDILLNFRQWNFKAITHSGMQYSAFITMREIRKMTDPTQLALYLHDTLVQSSYNLDTENNLRLHGQNGRYIKALLARLTDHVEVSSGSATRFDEYMAERTKNRYEIEHIWANHAEQHTDDFAYAGDFEDYRNRVGGLVIVPKKFNASYGDLPYESKLPHYLEQNLLAKSLNSRAYKRNPGFNQYLQLGNPGFRAHDSFRRSDLDERQELYRELAKQIWDPKLILNEVGE